MSQRRSRSAQLNGLTSLAYVGVLPNSPTNFIIQQRAPTTNDYKGVYIGDVWLDNSSMYNTPPTAPTGANLWILVSTRSQSASWINFYLGAVVSVGAGNLINITGTATSPIVNVDTTVAASFITSAGTAIPAANALTLVGAGGTTISGAGSTITITSANSAANSFITDNGTAVPVANAITFNAISQAGSSVSFSGATSIVRLNTTDALGNTNIGSGAGNATITSTNCTLLGKNTGHALTSSPNNTIVGALSGSLLAGGSGANTIVGELSAASLLTGSGNIILGKSSGSALVGAESNNVLIGHPGIPATNGSVVMAVPNGRTFFIWDGADEFYVGIGSGNVGTNAVNNVVFGAGSLPNVTTASANLLIGNNIMTTATSTGSFNVAVGTAAFNIGTGILNTIIGDTALGFATTASNNVALGHAVGYNSGASTGITTGSNNTMVGYNCANAYTSSESSNIVIGYGITGTVGESNVLRIGDGTGTGAGQINKTFISGIRGITTANANAVAVLIDSAGQLGTVSSSARYKDNIEPMASYSHALMHLRPVVFNYKNHSPESKSVGLIAEEVATLAPQLVVYDADGLPETVKYLDLIPMLLNEIQKLNKRIEKLEGM